jgi:hypothetical protein
MARSYAGIRDERQDLSRQEKKAKDQLAALMKKHQKNRYYCQGVEIKRVIEKETVRVKIHKAKKQE